MCDLAITFRVAWGVGTRGWVLAAALMGLAVAGLPRLSVAQGDPPQEIVFLQEWGQRGSNPGEFDFPIAIAVNAADELFVTDHLNNRIQRFNTRGELLGCFDVLPNPGGICLDPAGNIYLTHFVASGQSKDKSGNRLSVYSADGRLLRQWGQSGSGDGQFDCPGGMALAADGRIYVADQTNHRIQVFDQTGKFLLKWGEHGNGPGQFGGKVAGNSRVGGPQFVAVDAAGNVWTTEGANCRIQKFTAEGRHLLAWGTSDDQPGGFGGGFTGFKGRKPGGIVGPIALCFDKDERLWASDVSGRVQQFTQDGQYLRGLVEPQGSGPGQFYAPHGIAFDGQGCLYVVDAFNHRIQRFRVAHTRQ